MKYAFSGHLNVSIMKYNNSVTHSHIRSGHSGDFAYQINDWRIDIGNIVRSMLKYQFHILKWSHNSYY